MSASPPLIDCDVHHVLGRQARLSQYLPAGWRAYVEQNNSEGMMPMMVPPPYLMPYEPPVRDGESLAALAEDIDTARTAIFEEPRLERAVLTYSDLRRVNGLRSPYYAAEIAKAANRWTTDEWLEKDSRLYGSILVATHLPELAAKEIKRAAAHPRMVQVILTGSAINAAYGHPIYAPIFEGANELGLRVAICGGSVGGLTPPAASGGLLSYWAEYKVLGSQTLMTHLVSVLASGILDRYPDVQLVLLGGGIGWIPAVLWRLDVDYRGCRAELPWLKELPSETFAERVRVATNPLDAAPNRAAMDQLLECFNDPSGSMLYSSGFPDGEMVSASELERMLNVAVLARVCHENARHFYRWEDAPV